MKFVLVNAAQRTVETVDEPTVEAAYGRIGLDFASNDDGVLARASADFTGIGFVVYEYSLYADPSEQHYFALGNRMFAGNACFYGFDQAGETVDMSKLETPRFLTAAEAEVEMREGTLVRPEIRFNGMLMWRWPEQRPADQAFTEMSQGAIEEAIKTGNAVIIDDGDTITIMGAANSNDKGPNDVP